jgi:hypothetical protein
VLAKLKSNKITTHMGRKNPFGFCKNWITHHLTGSTAAELSVEPVSEKKSIKIVIFKSISQSESSEILPYFKGSAYDLPLKKAGFSNLNTDSNLIILKELSEFYGHTMPICRKGEDLWQE